MQRAEPDVWRVLSELRQVVRRARRGVGRKAALVIAVVVILAVAVGGGVALRIKHDRDQDREAAAAERAADERSAQEEAEAEEAAAREQEEAQASAEQAEQRQRASIIEQIQNSITKDAKKRVTNGELEGPIYYTSCDPLGGGSVDDLTALTATFECIAVNEKLDGGQVRGWVFSATANWDEGRLDLAANKPALGLVRLALAAQRRTVERSAVDWSNGRLACLQAPRRCG